MKYYKVEMVIKDELQESTIDSVKDDIKDSMEDIILDIESFNIKPIYGPEDKKE